MKISLKTIAKLYILTKKFTNKKTNNKKITNKKITNKKITNKKITNKKIGGMKFKVQEKCRYKSDGTLDCGLNVINTVSETNKLLHKKLANRLNGSDPKAFYSGDGMKTENIIDILQTLQPEYFSGKTLRYRRFSFSPSVDNFKSIIEYYYSNIQKYAFTKLNDGECLIVFLGRSSGLGHVIVLSSFNDRPYIIDQQVSAQPMTLDQYIQSTNVSTNTDVSILVDDDYSAIDIQGSYYKDIERGIFRKYSNSDDDSARASSSVLFTPSSPVRDSSLFAPTQPNLGMFGPHSASFSSLLFPSQQPSPSPPRVQPNVPIERQQNLGMFGPHSASLSSLLFPSQQPSPSPPRVQPNVPIERQQRMAHLMRNDHIDANEAYAIAKREYPSPPQVENNVSHRTRRIREQRDERMAHLMGNDHIDANEAYAIAKREYPSPPQVENNVSHRTRRIREQRDERMAYLMGNDDIDANEASVIAKREYPSPPQVEHNVSPRTRIRREQRDKRIAELMQDGSSFEDASSRAYTQFPRSPRSPI